MMTVTRRQLLLRSVMFQDHAPVENWKHQKDYHMSTDLAGKAMA